MAFLDEYARTKSKFLSRFLVLGWRKKVSLSDATTKQSFQFASHATSRN